MRGASVSIHELTKGYDLDAGGRLLVFDRLQLEIRPGSFVAVLGPSGCGKSTLLRMMARLDPASNGRIEVTTNDNSSPCIGLMLQGYPSLPWLTVGQNVGLAVRTRRQRIVDDGNRSTVNDLLSRVGLFGWQDAYPRELSGGMLQRLALARTLAMQPDLVLLDEPLGALDALTRIELQLLLRDLHGEAGATFVMVTHDVEEALAIATRVVVLGPCGMGVLYDSDTAAVPLSREGLVSLLSSTHATFAAGTWTGYLPFAHTRKANGAAYRLWMGLSDAERAAALRGGRAAGAFFTVQALAEIGDAIDDVDPVVVHAFSRPATAAVCEHILLSPRTAELGPTTRWIAPESGLERAIIRRLAGNVSDTHVGVLPSRAACVEAVADGRADACVADVAFARRILGWWTFRRCGIRPLPDDVWPDLWTVLIAARGTTRYTDGAVARAVRAFGQDVRVAGRLGNGGSVHYFTLEESAGVLKNGEVDRLIERWGGRPMPVALFAPDSNNAVVRE